MSQLTHEYVNKILMLLLTLVLLIAMGMLSYFIVWRLSGVAKQSATYNRFIACALSVPALERDQKKIDQCWVLAQSDTGLQVKRYDNNPSL